MVPMGSKRSFAYGDFDGKDGPDLAEQVNAGYDFIASLKQGHDGPSQPPLGLDGRTTYKEQFCQSMKPRDRVHTPATVAAHRHFAIIRGDEPQIVWDDPLRCRPEGLRGMADKNISRIPVKEDDSGGLLVKETHYQEAFKEPRLSTPFDGSHNRPKNCLAVPDSRLFSSYQTSYNRCFKVEEGAPPPPVPPPLDDTSRVMGAQIPNRVRDLIFQNRALAPGSLKSLPPMIEIMPQATLVKKLQAAKAAAERGLSGSRPGSRPGTGMSRAGSRPGTSGALRIAGVHQASPNRPGSRAGSIAGSRPGSTAGGRPGSRMGETL